MKHVSKEDILYQLTMEMLRFEKGGKADENENENNENIDSQEDASDMNCQGGDDDSGMKYEIYMFILQY